MAAMDDDDSKVRRNLTVAGGLVILAVWLAVPLDQLLERIAGLSLDKTPGAAGISPLRVWSAVLAVLMYLALRYRFAPEGRRLARAFRRERGLLVQRYVRVCVRGALLRYSRKGRDSPIFHGELHTFASQATKSLEANLHGEELPRPTVTASFIQIVTPYQGNAGLTFIWQRDTTQAAATSGAAIGFEVAGFMRWRVACRATVEALTYSRASTQHILPVAFGVTAIGIALFKIATSF
jgi:hypothetical protein